MSASDDLDREIDKEMGWDRGDKKPRNHSVRRRPDYWQALLNTARVTSSPFLRAIKAILRPIAKIVFFPIMSPLSYSKHFNVQGDMVVLRRSLPWRIADGLITRVILAPLIIAIFLVAVVYCSTHPATLRASNTPDGFGMYYKTVSLFSVDNQRLSAWYIPPISADDVAFDPDGVLLVKFPGVVLCHGLGATQDQYLPLARDLHAAGFAVLLLDTRGQGDSDPAAVTYGLRERMDVLAAVKFLRESIYIDPFKICVVGHDMGATAVLEAAALDSSITAVVADGLWPRFEERARDIFSHPNDTLVSKITGKLPIQWLAPLYTVAFEIAVRDRLTQLDSETVLRTIHTQPVLFIAREGPGFAPVQDVLNLATTAGSHHEVVVMGNNSPPDEWQSRTREFLIKSTGWKGAKAHGAEQIQDLLKNRIPKQ